MIKKSIMSQQLNEESQESETQPGTAELSKSDSSAEDWETDDAIRSAKETTSADAREDIMGNLVNSLRGHPREGAAVSRGREAQDYDTEEEKEEEPKPKKFKHKRPPMYRKWSDKDTKAYRNKYPGKKDNPELRDNFKFYTNRLSSSPNGGFIDDIHKEWFKDYRKLEEHHGYIQWLFPIREAGVNFHAQELQLHEAKDLQKDSEAMARFRRSYEMMLDFYGFKLKNPDTGQVIRSANWKERFAHLNRSMHNYLRITRILKSLGELGHEHYKVPFLDYIMKEIFEKNTLINCADSCVDYWINTVRNTDERSRLLITAYKHYDD